MAVSETKNIDAAILAAQRAVAPLAKTATATVKGKTKSGQAYTMEYKFVPGEMVVAHGLDALHAHGVSWDVRWEPFDFGGATWLKVIVRLCHPESGEVDEREYPMPVKGRGDLDKAVAGAITYCKGYAMAALCGIVREDEAQEHPDRRQEEVGDHEPEGRPTDPLQLIKADLQRYKAELARRRRCSTVDAAKAIYSEHEQVGDRPTLDDYKEWVAAAKALIAKASEAA